MARPEMKIPGEVLDRVTGLRNYVCRVWRDEPSSDIPPVPFKWEIPPDGYGPGIMGFLDGSYQSFLGYRSGFGCPGRCRHENGGNPGCADDYDSDTSVGNLFGDDDDSPDAHECNCNRVCKVNPIPIKKIETDPLICTREIQTDIAEQAAKYLRLVPTGSISPSPSCHQTPIVGDGLSSLVQVFSIRIKHKKNIDHEKRINLGDVYGTIEICKEMIIIPFYLYDRKQGDFKSIGPYDTLSLTGPSRCIDAHYFTKVRLNLKDKDGDLFPLEAGERWVSWDRKHDKYDTPMSQCFQGKFCSVTMYFIPFYDAVQAKVKVELVERGGKDRAHRVYGSIVTRYSNYDYSTDEKRKYWQNVLFYYPKTNYMKVNPRKLIPLSRSAVAVPPNSLLVIEAELWDYDKLIPDGEIATGTLEFRPLFRGETVQEINGDNGLLRVTVAWCPGD